jgi:hypothetical protein
MPLQITAQFTHFCFKIKNICIFLFKQNILTYFKAIYKGIYNIFLRAKAH